MLIQVLTGAIDLGAQRSLDGSYGFTRLYQVSGLAAIRPLVRLQQIPLDITGECSDAEIVPLGAVWEGQL